MFKAVALACVVFAASAARAGQNVVVVLDDSGSMCEWLRGDSRLTKMDAAKVALLTVLNQVPEEANIGVLLLNGRPASNYWAYPLAPINRNRLKTAIGRIDAEGGTPLGERLKNGADSLLEVRSREHYGTYRLLVVTDGEATDSNRIEDYLPDILSRGIRVDVIGVDMPSDHSLATRVHNYRRADDPKSLQAAITEVFAESTGGGDADESDFEVIAPIPNELAGTALLALSTAGNNPIQARAENLIFEDAMLEDGAETDDDDSSGMRTFMVGCIAFLLFVFWMVGSLSKKRGR